MAEVVENYTLAEIPLETVVIDTEAWSNREIFSLSEGYPLAAFQNFVDRLHHNGQKWVRTAATLNEFLRPSNMQSGSSSGICASFQVNMPSKPLQRRPMHVFDQQDTHYVVHSGTYDVFGAVPDC